MSRGRRWVWIAAAWAAPVAWVSFVLLSTPSDGTAVSAPVTNPTAHVWGEAATVVEAYGSTPLRAGDVVTGIDDRSFGDWASGEDRPTRSVGDVVRYQVVRPGGALDLGIGLEVELTRYPVADALARQLPPVATLGLLLTGASAVFWRRPGHPGVRALLGAAALLPAGLLAAPFGPGASDLATQGAHWPHVVSEVACALGLGLLVVVAATLVPTTGSRRARAATLALVGAPFVGYALWVVVVQQGRDHEAARLQVVTTVAGPALVATVVAVVGVLVHGLLHARDRQDRLAVRLVLLVLLGSLAARLLLGDVPRALLGRPLVRLDLLTMLFGTALLMCVVVALLRHRVDELEPVVRRALLYGAVATVVGGAFLGVAGTVDQSSDTSLSAVVTGGVVALLLVPVAVGLHRFARWLVYGDREFPRRVVSELRRLDPTADPAEALEEMLALLARRLRLSYASIDVPATASALPIRTAVGTSRGRPTTVDLVVGGAALGRLELEVAPDRDPFGPGDRRLLEDVGTQVGALVQATSVNHELQLSRQRLVSAREEERRRVRRDLHDGLGPSLAALALRLEAAQELVRTDPEAAAGLVGRISEQVRAQIDEVRRLVDGLRPPALDQLGLVSALQQVADEHQATTARADGATPSWTVEALGELDPLPAAVEVAAYRIVMEAVNNALRHSRATTCRVTLRREADALVVAVRDDGSGLPAAPTTGVGLSSMRERAAELGGTCTTTSSPGSGTVIEARLPLGARHESPRS